MGPAGAVIYRHPIHGAEAAAVKGIVFNLLEEIVVREHGENTWDQLLAAAKEDGAYTSLGSYADAELLALWGPHPRP